MRTQEQWDDETMRRDQDRMLLKAANESHLESLVHEAMDNRRENGYDCFEESAYSIAQDITIHFQPLELEAPAFLVPHIETWRSKIKP
jgi:hypothetical protein